ncbi:MAG: hypothetical protein AB7T10_04620 [bacterium]
MDKKLNKNHLKNLMKLIHHTHSERLYAILYCEESINNETKTTQSLKS